MLSCKLTESTLNKQDIPAHDHPRNGGRVPWNKTSKYGTWLRKNDPTAFAIARTELQY